MDAGHRTLLAEIVQILADGLRRNLEAPRQIFHRHPARGAGDVEDFGLAVGQSGHGGTWGCKTSPMVLRFAGAVNAADGPRGPILADLRSSALAGKPSPPDEAEHPHPIVRSDFAHRAVIEAARTQ